MLYTFRQTDHIILESVICTIRLKYVRVGSVQLRPMLRALMVADADADQQQLKLRVMTPDNDQVHLTLTKVTEEHSSIPTYVSGKHGKFVRWQEPEGYVSKY